MDKPLYDGSVLHSSDPDLGRIERLAAAGPLLLAVAKAIQPFWVAHIDECELSAAVKALDAAHPGWREWR